MNGAALLVIDAQVNQFDSAYRVTLVATADVRFV